MRDCLLSTVVLLGLWPGAVVFAQQSADPNSSKASEAPVPRRSLRPRLPLQNALKIARIMSARSTSTSQAVKFIVVSDRGKPPQEPAWFFWWVSDDGAMGNSVDITVFMDGHAVRMRSM
jgi:hypothetical protein